jgi:hypothetical protein
MSPASLASPFGEPGRGLLGVVAILALASLIACSGGAGDPCHSDRDCPLAERCVADADLGRSYCTRPCDSDADCGAARTCAGDRPDERVCVERVRRCGAEEPCNGLDDDCDGRVDDGCAPVVGCTDDRTCGAFTCQATSGAASTACAAPPAGGLAYGRPCGPADTCVNGACVAGFCTSLCRGASGERCPGVEVGGALREAFCAEAVDESGPPRNQCQLGCSARGDCPAGTDCVWRAVLQAEPFHAWVCSSLDPSRGPLGSTCPANDRAGDAGCQHGLCLGRVCTRICGGPGASCADVGPDFQCVQRQLFYGVETFAAFVCTRGGT